ncbi:MAG: HAMP domain-containing protein [Oligoflexia bacterium]|nr:HAMP domain-containing protein [Oligoflexia bacterium]
MKIAIKLILITVLLLLVATISITLRSSHLFEKVSSSREDDVNGNQANVIADQVQNSFTDIFDKIRQSGDILYRNFPTEAMRDSALDLSFKSDRDLISVEVLSIKSGQPISLRKVINDAYLKQYDLKTEFMTQLRQSRPFPFNVVSAGEVEIRNSTIPGGAPLLTIGLPLVKDENGNITDIVLADIRLDRIQKLFSSISERIIYLVDRQGRVLAHPNEKLALDAKNLNYIPVVSKAITQSVSKGQMKFEDPDTGETFVAAFAKTPFGVTVISQVPEEIILEPSRHVRREAFFITGLVLSAALFFIILFAATLTRPLEILVEATKKIAKGDFNSPVHIATKDEVGELASSFDKMIDGLKERDKVKTLFGKFHGTGIANKLMSGEMKLGGENRDATVFFSDIRGFTSFSEKVTPEDVVNMLNEYFKIMVSIINANHGVVDKFIGDAIMAVWGAPESHGNDAANALKACIQMRVAVEKLNQERIAKGQPEIKIGMGLHSGPLIAGTIGSDDRMEYTVIGDTVNMASRIEAATKAYGTDLLVSEVTYERVKDLFISELAGTAEVKGKSEPLKLFKVQGYVDESGQSIIVETKYSSYTAEAADKVKTH